MKKWILLLLFVVAPLVSRGQNLTPNTLFCMNPSGAIIPMLQAGMAAPTNYPGIQAFGTNSLNQSVALQCDASGNLLANATSIGGIPFIDVPTPVLSDVICFDGVAWTPCPPTAGPAQILYITNTVSDISTYDLWDTVPLGAQFTVAASIPATNTKTLIKAFATASGYPNLTVIPAGEWQADSYAQISSSANTTTLNIDVYDRTSGGVETLLFSFADINITTTALTHYTVEAVEPALAIAATDRIVIKYNMTHNAGSAITGTLYGGGSTNYSHIHTPIGTSSGGGTAVNVNGSSVSNPNFNGTTPAAEAGKQNVTFQVSGSSVSAEVPLSAPVLINVVPNTGDGTISAANLQKSVLTNTGASGAVALTLGIATCTIGQTFTAYVTAAQTIKLIPFTGDQIMIITSAPNHSITSDAVIGTFYSGSCLAAGKWYLTGLNGSWTDTN